MRSLIAIAAATFVLSVAAPAAVAGPPEYNRGYNDCQAGRYDEGAAQYSRSYRQGMPRRARGKRGRRAAASLATAVGIPNVRGMEPVQALARWRLADIGTSAPRWLAEPSLGFYFNPQTGECVQFTSVNGRVVDARDIGANPRCR